jgi:hypothetical protein
VSQNNGAFGYLRSQRERLENRIARSARPLGGCSYEFSEGAHAALSQRPPANLIPDWNAAGTELVAVTVGLSHRRPDGQGQPVEPNAKTVPGYGAGPRP